MHGITRWKHMKSARELPQDDLLDVLHWWKQAVALVVGAVCGYCGVLNLPGVLTFLAVTVLTTIIMYKSYLK